MVGGRCACVSVNLCECELRFINATVCKYGRVCLFVAFAIVVLCVCAGKVLCGQHMCMCLCARLCVCVCVYVCVCAMRGKVRVCLCVIAAVDIIGSLPDAALSSPILFCV